MSEPLRISEIELPSEKEGAEEGPGAVFHPGRSSGSNGQASMFSSTVNLANSVLGVGLLALPRAFSQAGIGIGLLLLFYVFALSVTTCHFLTQAAGVVGRPCTVRAVSDRAFPLFSLFVDSAVCINNIGASCSYMIVAVDGFSTVFAGGSHRPLFVIVTLCIVAPLSFMKKLDALRHTSLAAVVILIFLTIVAVAYASHKDDTSKDDILAT